MERKGALERGEERSGFGEGKGKGPGKAPKQIRVPPLTDRKFVEVRPRDSASRLSRRDRLSQWSIRDTIDCFVILGDIHDYIGEQTGCASRCFSGLAVGLISGLMFQRTQVDYVGVVAKNSRGCENYLIRKCYNRYKDILLIYLFRSFVPMYS